MASIHLYGDSNTYGIGDPEGGGYASRLRTTMISRISSCLTEPLGEKRGIIVHNVARFAMTLPQVVEMLPQSLADRDGRGRLVAAAMIGLSDSVVLETDIEPVVPLGNFRMALTDFTSICNQADYPVHRVFIEYPLVDLTRPHPKNPGVIDPVVVTEYQEAIWTHAKHTGASFVETHAALDALPQDPLSADGIHLSAAGHAAVHDLVLPYIDDLLQ